MSLAIADGTEPGLTVGLRPVSTAPASWEWNSEVMEAAVRSLGVRTRRVSRARFVTSDSQTWSHTMAPPTFRAWSGRMSGLRNKQVALGRLEAAGVQVAPRAVFTRAGDAARFVKAHAPVVVKPVAGCKGSGVTVGVSTPVELDAAARAAGSPFLVEPQLFGVEYRIFATMDGALAAVRRDPPSVVGDGRSTLLELVAAENGRRVSPTLESMPAPPVDLAGEVPAPGEVVVVSRVANVSTGGVSHDVTDLLGTDLAREAALAVAAVDAAGVLHGGVDVLAGHVLEVNHAASLRVHLAPAHGSVRRVDLALAERYHL